MGRSCPADSFSPISGSGIRQLVLPSRKKHQPKTNKLIPPQSHNHSRFQLIVCQAVPQLPALFPLVRAGVLRCSLCVSSSSLWLHRSFPRKRLYLPGPVSSCLTESGCFDGKGLWHSPLAGLCFPDKRWGKVKTSSPCSHRAVAVLWLYLLSGSCPGETLAAEEEKIPAGTWCILECLRWFWVGKLFFIAFLKDACIFFNA